MSSPVFGGVEYVVLLLTSQGASGTLVENGWYVNNVSIIEAVSDDASDINSQTGCSFTRITSDLDDTTFNCNATGGGAASEFAQSRAVLQLRHGHIRRDALSGLASESYGVLNTSTVSSTREALFQFN